MFDSLQNKHDKNINHICNVAEMMIRKEPPEAMTYFFKHNIML